MSSFIFNSRYAFAIKVITVCFALSTLYWFSSRSVNPAEMRSQNQGQENKLKLETLIKEDLSNKTILVGSSLSARLEQEYLGPTYFNFGLGGESALVALTALRDLQIRPRSIVVELNVIRTPSVNLLEQITKLRFLGLLFSESQQPVTRLITFLKPKYVAPNPFIPELYKIGLEDHLKAVCPTPEEESKRISTLKKEIDFFKTSNTTVYLLKIPIDTQIEETACSKQYWKLVHDLFGNNIIEIGSKDLQTNDGIHLTGDSAKKVAKSLAEAVSNNLHY